MFENPPSKLLDIGGNTGKFAMSAAALDHEVRLTICDLPGQLRVAKKHIEKAGLKQRITGYEINLLDENAALPPGHDAAWMSQFLCCFSEAEIVGILGRVRDAVGRDGRVFIMDTFWDRQEHEAAAYALIVTSLYFTAIANGNSRMYTYDAMDACIQSAGLVVERIHDNKKTGHTLLVCRPEEQR